jgi:phosphoribosylformylglycinamidine synthase
MCLDGNGKFVAIDPRMGAKLAVAEAARNVVCVGAQPIAVTNCLNFASPERPEVMWDFSEVIDGMAEACNAFDTPVVSGNVSFYNETDGAGIIPTPVIGMVGLIEDTRKIVTHGFKAEGDLIALLGVTKDDLAASEFAQSIAGISVGDIVANGVVPQVDLQVEKRLHDTLLSLVDACLLRSAHDCSDGGVAVALAECCFSSLGRKALGAEIELSNEDISAEAMLFGETPSRVVISFAAGNLDRVRELVGDQPFEVLGRVGGSDISVKVNGETAFSGAVTEFETAWRTSLGKILEP